MAISETLKDLGEKIAAELAGAVRSTTISFGELTIIAEAQSIVQVLTYLRDEPHCRFVCFIDICGVDYPERANRFDVVYHLLSPYENLQLRKRADGMGKRHTDGV